MIHKTMCPMNCHPTYCGMEVKVDGNSLIRIRGDKSNPCSKGFLCRRGQAAHEIIGNPLRLSVPQLRRGSRGVDRWDEIGWDEALDRISGAMTGAGMSRVALWPGHGAIVNSISRQLFMRLGLAAGMQTWRPQIVCWALGAFGLALTGPLETHTKEDLEANAQSVILWGANVASQPTTTPHLVAAKKRGAYVTAIDVRESEASRLADEFILIRPGTDAALALAMMHVIVDKGLVDRGFVGEHTAGFEDLARRVKEHPPEWAEPITGVAAETIRGLARRYATTRPSMIVLGGASLYKQRHGWEAARAISCLPALTGYYGMPGGGLGPRHASKVHGQALGTLEVPSRLPPEQAIPSHMGAMFEALESGRIDVLFLAGTNMLSSFSDTSRLRRALDNVGLIVAHDIFANETTREIADIVLPGTSWLEETGLKATFTHVYLMDQALPPYADARPLGEVVRGLANRLGLTDAVYPWATQEDATDVLLATLGPGAPTVASLRASDGRFALNVSHVAHPENRYATPSGKIELYSAKARDAGLDPLPGFTPLPESDRLSLRVGRDFTHFHGFYDHARALPSLAAAEPEPQLFIHVEDARARGLVDGAAVRLANERGGMTARAKTTLGIARGTAWMHDGWAELNSLTSSEDALAIELNDLVGFAAGQSTYEAIVDVHALA